MAGNWPKSSAELTFDKALGSGAFGEVWSCRFKADPHRAPIAVKRIPIRLIRQHNLDDQMEREIKILAKLDHPHIVKLHCDWRDDSCVYLGMDFAAGGSMFNRLITLGKFALEPSAQYFYETCDALEYLHRLPEKVIHRDIKPENILFDKDRHVKLADFGWSNMMLGRDSRDTFCGALDYLAPEGHNESLDMWGMGVLLYELIVGKSPIAASSQDQTCQRILKRDLQFPGNMDPDAKDCITRLCKISPDDRITAKQAKAHVFVIRHHKGRPPAADAIKATQEDADDPWVLKLLRKEKGILEGQMQSLLEAKCKLEMQMLDMSTELESGQNQMRREKARPDKAEAELARRSGSGYNK